MSNDLKAFIEKNINIIEYEDWDHLFEQAYEWLTHDQCKELMSIIKDSFNIDLVPFAAERLRRQIMLELQNYAADAKAKRVGSIIYLHSFNRKYFNHNFGLPYAQFAEIVQQQCATSKKFEFSQGIDGENIKVLRR